MRNVDVDRTRRWIAVRMVLAAVVFFGLFAVIVLQARGLQLDEGDRLREMAEQQYLKSVEIPARRGTIFDRHGAPLAVSVDVDSIFANPRMIGRRAASVARKLAPLLGLKARRVRKTLRSRRYFAWVKRRVDRQTARRIKALDIRGIYLTKEGRRFYPNKGLGGLVVGFAGLDSRGLGGIELSYNDWLRGNARQVASLRDALGRPVLSEGHQDAPHAGHDVVLTIDKSIQFHTEQALAEAYANVDPETGWVAAVVMDPQSGDIVAMANAPAFDPNRYAAADPAARRNRTVTDAFEPGSTLKVFTVAGALEHGVIEVDSIYDCEPGVWRIGGRRIHDTKPHGRMDIAGILKKSSNIGAAKIGFDMGKPLLHRALADFGFGQPTGIELPGERSGVLRPWQNWSDIGLANVAFGHGLTVTVLQLARALSAVANGGRLMKPRLVLRVTDAEGKVVEQREPQGQRVIRREVADAVRQMLIGVTERGGTATRAALQRYTVAGKTGTAQKVDPETRAYTRDHWLSSFIGMVPASRPRLTIAVVVDEPSGKQYYGGQVAAPIFHRIAKHAMRYLGVKPDREGNGDARKVQALRQQDPTPVASSTPARSGPPPLPSARPRSRGRGLLTVPDFTGMSIAEAISAARRAGLRLKIEGSGYAVGQSPGPGSAPRGTICRLSFRPAG